VVRPGGLEEDRSMTRLRALVLSLTIPVSLSPGLATGQTLPEAPGAVHRPTTLTPGKHDRTPNLRDLPPLPIEQEPEETPHPPLPIHGGRAKRPHVSDAALQTATPSVNAIAPSVSFGGIGNLSGVLPPDTNGDVGPNHYVQWVNLSFAVYDKSGNVLYGPVSGKTIWQGFGGPCSTRNDGDPIVLYDEVADRWLMSQFALPNYPNGPFYQCVAVSTTGDPLGAWNRYSYTLSKLNDYPKFGVWSDGYYMSINQFTCNIIGCSWAGQGVVAFERSQMIAGGTARAVYFDLASNQSLGGMLPADLDGPTPPPESAPNYFVQFDDQPDQLQLWEFHVDWSNPNNSTFTQRSVLPTAAFDSDMCNGSRNCIAQAGTNAKIDALADRLMYRLQYRNFGDHDSLVTNHTVDTGSDRGGVRWYELRNPHTAPVIYQQGSFAPADTLSRWMGSAAMDKDGNLAIGYSASNSQTFPAIRFTGRLKNDALGTLTVAESDLRQGTGSQTHTSGRWGDYSMLAVDPSDGCTFWFTSEYYSVGATSAGWSTNIGSFKLGNCGGSATPPDAPTNLSATAFSSSQINLIWSDNSNDETGFRIERCQDTGSCTFALVTTVAANTTTFADSPLQPSTTYRYRVFADKGALRSSPSNEAPATTAEPPPSSTVMHVSALTGSSAPSGKSGWQATVVTAVQDGNNQAVENVTVTGNWSAGFSGTASCVTGPNGTCTVTTPKLSNGAKSVTFSVSNLSRDGFTYNSGANAVSSTVVNK
jgi:Fibronectin type III domain